MSRTLSRLNCTLVIDTDALVRMPTGENCRNVSCMWFHTPCVPSMSMHAIVQPWMTDPYTYHWSLLAFLPDWSSPTCNVPLPAPPDPSGPVPTPQGHSPR